jgi:chaperonin GroEL
MGDVIILDRESKEKILKGVSNLARSVSVALGPFEKNAIIRRYDGAIFETRDAEVIAKMVSSEDQFEQFGIEMMRASCGSCSETLILAEGIFRAGMKFVFEGANPFLVKKELDEALPLLLKELDQMALQGITPIKEIEVKSGYVSPYFITNPVNMSSELDEPYIYLTDQRLKRFDDVLPLLESLKGFRKPSLLIVAEDVFGEALDLLVINHLKNNFQISVIKNQNDQKKIALLTGAEIAGKDFGVKFFGRAKKVVVDGEITKIEVDGISEGKIVPGNGVSYIRALQKLQLDGQNKIALEILGEALLGPLKVIAENAHMNSSIVLATVLAGEADFGLQPEGGIFAPLLTIGIRESLEDVKKRLIKGISASGLFLTVETIINPKSAF